MFEYKKGIPKTIKVFQRNPLCFLNLSLFVVSLQKSCIYSFSSKRDGYKVFQGKQSFPRETKFSKDFPNKNGIWREGHDTNKKYLFRKKKPFWNKKYLFKKWLTKKNLFEGRATTQTKNGFFLSTIFWKDTNFVSWPSLQILFLKRYKVFVRDPTIIAIVLRIQTTVAQQLFIFFCYRFIRDNKNIEKTKTFKVYWAWKDLNLRLYAYQAYTLNHWVTRP